MCVYSQCTQDITQTQIRNSFFISRELVTILTCTYIRTNLCTLVHAHMQILTPEGIVHTYMYVCKHVVCMFVESNPIT